MTISSTGPRKLEDRSAAKPSLVGRVGLDFFETHAVADLQHWPEDVLAGLGPLQLPMWYDARTDRYRAGNWQKVLAEVGAALLRASSIVLVGSRTSSAELEAFQLMLSDWLHCPVDLLLCIDERSPGHIRLTTELQQSVSAAGKESTVLLVLGDAPPPEVLAIGDYDILVCLTQRIAAAMFRVRGAAFALPLSAQGWRISHIAFHRLIDIETEQMASIEYGSLTAGDACSSLPLCAIVAEIRAYIQLRRQKSTAYQKKAIAHLSEPAL